MWDAQGNRAVILCGFHTSEKAALFQSVGSIFTSAYIWSCTSGCLTFGLWYHFTFIVILECREDNNYSSAMQWVLKEITNGLWNTLKWGVCLPFVSLRSFHTFLKFTGFYNCYLSLNNDQRLSPAETLEKCKPRMACLLQSQTKDVFGCTLHVWNADTPIWAEAALYCFSVVSWLHEEEGGVVLIPHHISISNFQQYRLKSQGHSCSNAFA